MSRANIRLLWLLSFVGSVGLPPLAARAQSPWPPIAIVVGSPAGGGYDSFARLMSRHIGAFLPGNPGVVVRDMPGGGSLIATNWIANVAPKDGSALAIVPNGVLFEALLGNKSAQFDGRKLNIIGSLNVFTSIGLAWHASPFANANDFLHGHALIGASAANSNNSIVPNLLNSMLGANFNIVHGYPGSTGIDLALERGEVQGQVGPDWGFLKATHGEWVRTQKVRVLIQATLKRHAELPDAPSVMELVSAENRDVLALLIGRQVFGGLFVAPPDVKPEVVAALRAAFEKAAASPALRAEAEHAGLTIQPAGADEINATMGRLLASPPDVIARATVEMRKIDAQ